MIFPKKLYLVIALMSLSCTMLAMERERMAAAASSSASQPAAAEAPGEDDVEELNRKKTTALHQRKMLMRQIECSDITPSNSWPFKNELSYEEIQKIIEKDEGLNVSVDELKALHLCYAAYEGDLGLYNTILSQGAQQRNTTLLAVCEGNKLRDFNTVGGNDYYTVSNDAKIAQRKAIIRLILSKQTGINLADACGITSLMEAVTAYSLNMVHFLLSQAAIRVDQVDVRGMDALQMAKLCYLRSPKRLLYGGKERRFALTPTCVAIEMAWRQLAKFTARMLIRHLMLYTRHGRVSKTGLVGKIPVPADVLRIIANHVIDEEFSEVLAQDGVRIPARDVRLVLETAKNPAKAQQLIECAAQNKLSLASILLELGANPLIRDFHGNTALHSAVLHGHVRMVRFLANVAPLALIIKNEEGKTPVDCAIATGKSADILLALAQ